MKIKTCFAICLSVVAAFSADQEAWAGQTIYPGVMCQRWGGSNGVAYYSGSGRVINASYSNKLTVICPIPTHGSNPPTNAHFAALNQSPKGQVCCHYETRSSSASTAVFLGPEACAKSKKEDDIITVTIPTNPFTIPLGGFALLICTIPPKMSNTQEAALTLYAVSD
jgi:hypothetical protein